MVNIISFKKFSIIKRYFEQYRKVNDDGLWLIVQTNDLRRFVDTSGNPIHTFDELKNKILQKLTLMGYSNVCEIPDGMTVEYQN